ncbi:MAG: C-factor [Chlamydiae bacterium]|nr:C-factor [Chlamydiota bacterium]
MKGTAVVTGANRGIGLEFCKQLKAQGYDVIALCRTASPELWTLGVEVFENIDVTQPQSLQELVDKLPPRRIDLLINNAGILERGDLEDFNTESLMKQFEVNAVGPLHVTRAILPYLGEGSKIAMITSLMGSIGDNTSGGRYGYRMSKAAMNIAGKSLAHDLKDRGISVIILSPGSVRTDMTNNAGRILPEESIAGLLQEIDKLKLETTGKFVHYDGREMPW